MAGVRAADSKTVSRLAAIDEPGALRAYKSDVRWRIHEGDLESYREAARAINASNADIVSVQHEFGLYGIWSDHAVAGSVNNESGYEDYLAGFLQELRKPVITTLHTLLPKPSASIRKTIRGISDLSDEIIVMSEADVALLRIDYGIKAPPRVFARGMPSIEPSLRALFKARMGVEGRSIISTFGLLDPRKGIQYMIGAMPAIAKRHPEALYLIAGQTHPDLLRTQGESYRNGLVSQIRSLGLNDHVAFIDHYMLQRDVVDLLLGTDVYVTPYLDPNQINSGTLSYALGAGRAVVSTRYLHATEALADGRGLLVDFANSSELAAAVNEILEEPATRRSMEQLAFAYALSSSWLNVGSAFLDIAQQVIDDAQQRINAAPHDWPRSSDLGRRALNNPILTAADVPPSTPSMEVVSVFNAAAAKVDNEFILLLRVGERPRTEQILPEGALTLDLSSPEPRVVPLGEGFEGSDMVSLAFLDTMADPPRVVDVFLPRSLTGLDLSDPRRVRYHDPTGGFSAEADDFNDFLTQMSHLRVARSHDGLHFRVDPDPAVQPANRFEEYGCEDPRATLIDGVWHITYVSVGRIGITTSRLTTTDFRSYERQGVMFLPDHKDVAIFPEKVAGRYVTLTRPMPQSFGRILGIWIAFSDDLVHWGDHQPIALPRPGMWDELRIGASAVPFRVPGGWLEIYHGVNRDTHYSLGGLLLDLEDPTTVIARSPEPILVPIDSYERSGLLNNTVFSCGHVALDETGENIRVYYGAGDSCMAAADFCVQDILDQMVPS